MAESKHSEREKLADFVPLACGMVEMHLESDVAKAWSLQVKELRKSGEDYDDDNSWDGNVNSKSRLKFPMQPRSSELDVRGGAVLCGIGRDGDNLEKVYVPVISMKKVPNKPMMTYWTHVDSNIRIKPKHGSRNQQAELDALLDEYEDESVRKFIESSKESASGERSKAKELARTLMDDQRFINVIKTMLEYEGTDGQQKSKDMLEIPLSESNVFHAVSQACPGIGFPFEVRDRYEWLTRHESKSKQNRSTIIPRGEVLKVAHQNFCRRCLLYNCLLHDKEERVDVRSVTTSPDFQESEPCGPSCYRLRADTHASARGSRSTYCENETLADVSQKDVNVSGYASMDFSDSSDEDVTSIEDDSGSDDSIKIVGSVLCNTSERNSNDKVTSKVDGTKNDVNQVGDSVAEKEFGLHQDLNPKDQESETRTQRDARKIAQDAYVGQLFDDENKLDRENPKHPEPGILKEWSDDELSVYSSIRVIWPNNFCEMARVIRTKTCFEVFKLNREKLLHCAEDQVIQQVPTPTKRKKIVQDRVAKTWFNHCKQYSLILARKPKDKPANQPVYTPCNHPNRRCDLSECCCLQKHIPCEKFCSCFHDEAQCENLYPGCQCQGACSSNTCQCFIALRECDVDLCSCGLKKILLQETKDLSCKNISIQMRQGKKVKVDISNVAGWGLFANEPIKKNEFIGEYVGEIISTLESERRGENYDRMKYTFLFTKDEENNIDGMFFGNLTRFINSSSPPNWSPNCYPLIKSVYGNLRIGLYASKNIAKHEELLFNYEKAIQQQAKNTECSVPTCSGAKIAMKTIPKPNSTPDISSSPGMGTSEPKASVACKSAL